MIIYVVTSASGFIKVFADRADAEDYVARRKQLDKRAKYWIVEAPVNYGQVL